MKIRAKILCLLLVLFSVNLISAQESKVKFGKIDKADLEMTTYEPDPEAKAVFLYDKGWLHFDYMTVGDGGFRQHRDRHVRIKVLKPDGVEEADFSFLLYDSPTSSSKEELKAIKGFTFNLVDGKEEKTKLTKEHIFYEKVSDNYTRCRITMPQVKEGSIIDLQYTYISDFLYTMPAWYFERMIPVVYTEYVVDVPQYLIYRPEMQGYRFDKMIMQETDSKNGKITMSGFQRSDGYQAKSRPTTSTVDYRINVNRWAAADVPAFRPEPYTSSPRNYLTRVEFELSATDWPGQGRQNHSSSWEKISKNLLEEDSFGGQLDKTNLVDEMAASLLPDSDDPAVKAAAIYQGVKSKVKWNGDFSYYPRTNVRKTLNEGEGNSASVNMVLLNALKAVGFDAHPVLISTRDHGFVNIGRPALSQFNHVVVATQLSEGKWVLLDATDRTIPFPLMPARNLNGEGRLILKEGSDWISLKPRGANKRAAQLTLAMDPEGNISGDVDMRYEAYAAYNIRSAWHAAADETTYWNEWMQDNPGLQIGDKQMEGVDDIYEKVNCKLKLEGAEMVTVVDDFMYVNPIMVWQEEENPFKLETRAYPVDFAYPRNVIYSMKLDIPEGYAIEELPENINLALPENGGKYSYSVKSTGSSIQLLVRFNIKQSLFVGDNYTALREFYDLKVDKESAQIVLKKKT